MVDACLTTLHVGTAIMAAALYALLNQSTAQQRALTCNADIEQLVEAALRLGNDGGAASPGLVLGLNPMESRPLPR